uniref:threonine--tRNA ligase n=1 Tax=Tetradesmus obliquus TaxID=3088 RepID=A0A383WA61_TETOB|eukprot:jgi/Sobl393_1/2855/SZX73989.1
MPIARLLRSVACPSHLRGLPHASSDQLGRIQAAAWLAARQSSTAARNTLAGKNIFQLRAAVETAEAATQQHGQQQQQPEIVPLPTSDESETLLRIRHSCAHIMAMAVQRLHKDAQVTIGPWIERGFYYDFDLATALSDKELKAIRKEMQKIMRMNLPFIREELSPEEAEARIKAAGEPYKLEILESIRARDPTAPITIYHIGETDHPAHWWDLCAGPHVESTGAIKPDAFELESVAGAYWRGDEKNAMLQRIYGTAWESAAQLASYQALKAEAARRDHRKLGAELDLFSIQESAGGGLVFWHPRGAIVRHHIETFWKELHLARGYDLVYSPHIAKVDLWKTSGHFDFYAENMYDQMQVEHEEYQLKPMNCPFHVAMYKDGYFSYRDLPKRWAELGTVYRYERSGTMHGLFRVRGFTQDDAHIFCLPEQIEPEIRGVLDLVQHPDCCRLGWPLPTCACCSFDMTYVDANAAKQRPIMIHRAIFGSMERFFGILVENYAGAFPLWLAPVQARLLPVNDAVVPYVQEVAAKMRAAGVRVEVLERASIAKMIRNAERAKTPVMAVVGAKEAEAGSLAVRLYGGSDLGALPADDVIGRIVEANKSRGSDF